jgi:hypothetical protein
MEDVAVERAAANNVCTLPYQSKENPFSGVVDKADIVQIDDQLASFQSFVCDIPGSNEFHRPRLDKFAFDNQSPDALCIFGDDLEHAALLPTWKCTWHSNPALRFKRCKSLIFLNC